MIRYPRIPLLGSRYGYVILDTPSMLLGFGGGLLLGLVVAVVIILRFWGRWA